MSVELDHNIFRNKNFQLQSGKQRIAFSDSIDELKLIGNTLNRLGGENLSITTIEGYEVVVWI